MVVVKKPKQTKKEAARKTVAEPVSPKKENKVKSLLAKTSTYAEASPTMADLLANYQWKIFKVGQEVEGIVLEKTKKVIYVDIGGKSEAIILDREIDAAKDYVDQLKIGDKIQAVVSQAENDRGQTILSLRKAAKAAVWGEFEEKLKTGEPVTVVGKEVNRGGLLVSARGLQGFIPASQFGAQYVAQVDKLINQPLKVKTIEVDQEKNRLVFSEKEISEAGLIEAQSGAIKKIKVGDVLEGTIAGIMPFGFFVKIKVSDQTGEVELEGLVHISEISWEKVGKPEDFYKKGEKIKVKVIMVDSSGGKLGLSLKRLAPDPWDEIAKKYPVEATVKGEVIRLAPFGAFVKLEPGIEALIHISKIPAERSIKVGDKVDCFVESVNKEDRKMSLGLVLKEKPVGYK